MDFAKPPRSRMLNIDEVQELLGISKPTIWRWVAEGNFPAPKALSPQTRRWWSEDVHAWIASKPVVSEALE